MTTHEIPLSAIQGAIQDTIIQDTPIDNNTALTDQDSMGYLLDELSVSKTVVPDIANETPAADTAKKEDKVDKVIVTVPPATSSRTPDDPAMFVWTGLDRFECNGVTAGLNALYDGDPDPETLPDGTWTRSFFDAATTTVPYADIYKKPLRSPTSKWRQEYGSQALGYANYWHVERVEHGEVLTGEKARRLAKVAIGGGRTENLPLWQSGFWITITPPLEADWNTLDEEILEQRKTFGWDHFGVAFSNYSVYLMEKLQNFALKFITTCSIMDDDASKPDATKTAGEVVREHIDYFDIPVLLAYVAHASYPNGFPYVRPAMLDKIEGGAGTLVPETLNLYRCVQHDFGRIDEWQISHMANRRRWSMSVEDVRTYQDHVSNHRKHNEVVEINEHLHLVLDTPTMAAMIKSTDMWLTSMKAALAASLTLGRSDGQRQESIRRHSRIATLRALAPWVASMRIIKDGKTSYIESRDDIDAIMVDARNDTQLGNKIYDGVMQYIGDTALSIVAVPVDPELPGMPKDGKDGTKQKMVPLDITSLVFILLEHVRGKSRG